MTAEHTAAELLRTVGISPKYKGYTYLLYMLILAAEDVTYTHNVSVRMYPQVARRYGSSPAQVERAVRFAVHRTWEMNRFMREFFVSYGIDYPPTNRECIAVLATRLQRMPLEPMQLQMF